MTLRKLASLIAKQEGKKHQASIADIREILKIIIYMEVEYLEGKPNSPIDVFYDESMRAYVKRIKRKK